MRRCPNCGRESADDERFCPHDGTPFADGGDAGLAVGAQIGHYRIIEQLGRGGLGSVYLAEEPALQRRVAIKILNRAIADEPNILPRFHAEARTTAQIHHPNVCTIYSVGSTADGLPFIAMEYVEGRTLGEFLDDVIVLPPERAARIAFQVSQGLGAAHRHGIIHRDLKPANIMMTPGPDGSETVKLLDFGIAKLSEPAEPGLTRAGFLIGTPEYMSPEQALGDQVSAASDIYSLALVYFRMLTGSLPFQASSALEHLQARLTREPVRLDAVLPDVLLPATQAVFDRALATQPQRRYESAHEFGDEIVRAMERDLAVRSRASGAAQAARGSGSASSDAAGERPFSINGLIGRLKRIFSSRTAGASGASGSGGAGAGRKAGEPSQAEGDGAGGQPPAPPPKRASGSPDDAGTLPGVPTDATVEPPGAPPERAVPSPSGDVDTVPAIPAQSGRRVIQPTDVTRVMTRSEWVPELPQDERPEAGEFTRLFRGPVAGALSSTFPVAVTITGTSDPRLVGKRVRCDRFPFGIGRDETADLAIPADNALSRMHVEIARDDHGFHIRDLSTNGIYVNGRHLRGGSEPLYFGTSIFLSKATSITFVADIPVLPDLSGQLLDGRFRLERRLHASVKAATFLAHDVRVPRRALAVKVFSPSLMQLGHYREEFERQARLAAGLKHPHVCKVLEFGDARVLVDGETRTAAYLCMEFMEGGNLAERLESEALLELDRLVDCVRALAGALDHAHRKGIVHGDLKPGCVVFDADGTPYLTDFALARSGDSEASAAVIGTPAFLAPEQWDCAPVTEATDQYSLAALTYLMVTGSRPHEGQAVPEVRRRNFARGSALAHEEARRAGREDVPPAVSDVLARAMSVNATERYASVLEFSDAFARAVSEPGRARAKPHVFMSYQRQASAAWAILFARALEEHHGFTVFVDTQAQDGSPQIPDRIRHAIADCDVFVCLLAPGTLTSAWVRQEIEIARECEKPMVPVFHEEFRPKDEDDAAAPAVRLLLDFDAVHLLDRRNVYVDHTIAELAERVRKLF